MIPRGLSILLKWSLTLGLIGGVLYVAFRVNGQMQAELATEASGDKVQAPLRAKDGVVKIGAENAARHALEAEPARATAWTERVLIYGRVVPNPRATFEVRAPFAGTLRADADTAWPTPGHRVQSGKVLGWVDIRVSTQERLSLQDNLNTARLKKQGAERVVQLQRERVNRIERLSQIVPGQQLDDARVLLAEAETQFAIASAAVDLWREALDNADKPASGATTYRQPLVSPADGEVTDVMAQPGMSIEAGGLVTQLVDFRRPLVRLDFPPQILSAGPPQRVQVFATSAQSRALGGVSENPRATESGTTRQAVLAGPAPRLDDTSQFVGYWYAVETATPKRSAGDAAAEGEPARELSALWRPGLQVQAHVTSPAAKPQDAVSVAVSSVLFHRGSAFAYVQLNPGEYQRREVRLLGREGDRWFLLRREGSSLVGLEPGATVVRRGAQLLLSEEFRSDLATE